MPTSHEILRREELSPLQLLRGVPLETVLPLLRGCSTVSLEPGEQAIRAGSENHHLYLILKGALTVHLASREEPVAQLQAGEHFGELSMIDRRPTSASVIATARSRLLAVDEDTLWSLVEHSHGISSNLVFSLAQRIRSGNQTLHHNLELLDEYRFQMLVDPLTGLYNRRWLSRMLPRQVQRSKRDDEPFALLMMDVDHFKAFNDRHGHLAGDRALRGVAEATQGALRPGDLAARYGGEEVVVLLPGASAAEAGRVAERVRNAVSRYAIPGRGDALLPSVTVSLGVAGLHNEEAPEDLLARADEALYGAKEAGRNRVTIHSAG